MGNKRAGVRHKNDGVIKKGIKYEENFDYRR